MRGEEVRGEIDSKCRRKAERVKDDSKGDVEEGKGWGSNE